MNAWIELRNEIGWTSSVNWNTWFGLIANGSSNSLSMIYTDGSNYNFSNWAEGEPNDAASQCSMQFVECTIDIMNTVTPLTTLKKKYK